MRNIKRCVYCGRFYSHHCHSDPREDLAALVRFLGRLALRKRMVEQLAVYNSEQIKTENTENLDNILMPKEARELLRKPKDSLSMHEHRLKAAFRKAQASGLSADVAWRRAQAAVRKAERPVTFTAAVRKKISAWQPKVKPRFNGPVSEELRILTKYGYIDGKEAD